MKQRWLALSARFAALEKRERAIIAGATVFGIAMIGHTFWVAPAQARLAALQKKIAKDKTEAQSLQVQVADAKAKLKDPDAPNKAALAEAKKRVVIVDTELHAYDHTLVPPERMPQLLQSIFKRHRGLELVSLHILPSAPLLGAPETKAEAKTAPGTIPKPAPAAPVEKGGIHKHGIEITMAGNYLDLLAYVADLERLPQKLLWDSMSLAVKTYPRSELTLIVYTLSLDPIWLVV